MQEIRLDLFIKNNYNFSREYAKEIILKGYVKVNNKIVLKPSFKIMNNDTNIKIDEKSFPKYVSRGGFKLEKALNFFKIDLTNKVCLDIGASTGGFSDCMIQNNAKKIYAIDVGTNQLDERLLNNEKIISFENTDIRNVEFFEEKIDFISIDVSFISITKIMENLYNLLSDTGEIVALIKPQFEAGKININKNGIVTNKKIHKIIIKNLYQYFLDKKYYCNGITFSPIKGGKGNIEYLINLKKSPCPNNLINISKIVDEAFQSLN